MSPLLRSCILSWWALFICCYNVHSFQIRLAHGGSKFMGRVEVNLDDGTGWGTVCDDSWDARDAKVVCRSLGLPSRDAIAMDYAYFGKGVGPINMDDVTCSGIESSLNDCSFVDSTNEDCDHDEDAAVICLISSIGTSFQAYIGDIDGERTSNLEGILMIKDYSRHHFNISVCGNGHELQEAQVACHELGYDRNLSTIIPSISKSLQNGVEYYLRVTFTCHGSEYRLSSCTRHLTHGWCPNRGYINPRIICNYHQAKQIEIYASKVSIRKIIMASGQKESIRCKINNVNPAPVLTWHINGLPYDLNTGNTTVRSGSLYKVDSILRLMPDTSMNGKELKCCSRDATGYVTCSDLYTLVVTDQIKRIEVYASKVSIRDIIMMSGQQESIRCELNHASPAPVLTWYINGWPYYVNTRSNIIRNGSSYKVDNILLLVPDTTMHGKELKCCSGDASGYQMCSDTYRLSVTVLPRLNISSLSNTTNISDIDTGTGLICKGGHSRPKPVLKWYKNGIPINESEGFSVKETSTYFVDQMYDITSTLTFKESSYRNGDTFTCVASIETYAIKTIESFIMLTNDDIDNQATPLALNLNKDEDSAIISTQIIAYCALGLTSLLLVIINICFIFHLRRVHSHSKGTTSEAPFRTNPSRRTESFSFENAEYHGNEEGAAKRKACYEQIQLGKTGKRPQSEEIYVNTITH